MNPLTFLNPLNTAVEATKNLVDVWITLKDRKTSETTSMLRDIADLLEELRRTHSTIVKIVSPLRRIADDPTSFQTEFTQVYDDFRDMYDAYDFLTERTRCHKLQQIRRRIQNRKPFFGKRELWNQLDSSLAALYDADVDIIDYQFKPFMASLDQTMNGIKKNIDGNNVSLTISEKKAFIDSLAQEYSKNKKMLDEMTEMIGKIESAL